MTRAFLLAGETSGDVHGALLARELRRLRPDLELYGVGGPRMEAAGVQLILSSRDIAVVGLVEVLSVLPRILKAYEAVSEFLGNTRPDVFVPIDFPDFNFRLLRRAHRLGIPIAYYISPQLWAWRSGRVEWIRRYVQRMIVIFPFEAEWYAERGVPVRWVGHPLVDHDARHDTTEPPEIRRHRLRGELRANAALDRDEGGTRPLVSILPGSRNSEVQRIGPVLAGARRHVDAARERAGLPPVQWVLGCAPSLADHALAQLRSVGPWDECDGWTALSIADLAILASGTATLEGLLLGTPMVVVYRMSPVTYRIARRLIQVEHIAMANLVAQETLVPELVQDEANPQAVAAHALDLLDRPEARVHMEAGLLRARSRLGGPGAAARAAAAVLEVMQTRKEAHHEGSHADAGVPRHGRPSTA